MGDRLDGQFDGRKEIQGKKKRKKKNTVGLILYFQMWFRKKNPFFTQRVSTSVVPKSILNYSFYSH